MNTKDRSILQQKAYNTLTRNRYIIFLHSQGENMAAIGREVGISRQRVNKILKRERDAKDDR